MAHRGRAHSVLILLLLSLGVLSAAGEEGSRLSCFMPSDYPAFWNSSNWAYNNPYVIDIWIQRLYLLQLHDSAESLGADSWVHENEFALSEQMKGQQDEKAKLARKEMKAFLEGEKQAKRDYLEEKAAYRRLIDAQAAISPQNLSELMTSPLCRIKFASTTLFGACLVPGINFVILLNEFLAKYNLLGLEWLSYTSLWENSMGAQLGSLFHLSNALNIAFASAQENADALEQMGAGLPAYSGAARVAYLNWTNFASSTQQACSPAAQIPDYGAPSKKYGIAYKIASKIHDASSYPDDIPSFSISSPKFLGASDFVSLAAGSGGQSLWAAAWSHAKALLEARTQMEAEYKSYGDNSRLEISSLDSQIASLSKASVEKFQGTGEFAQGSSQVEYSRYAGTPQERMQLILQDAATAEKLYDDGRLQAAREGEYGYLANAIASQRDSVAYSKQAEEGAAALLDDMAAWMGLAKQDSELKISSLEANMAQSGAYGQASSSLVSAKASLDLAKQAKSSGDKAASSGARYEFYRQASAHAEGGLSALSSPKNYSSASIARGVLERSRMLLSALKSDFSCKQGTSIMEDNIDAAEGLLSALPSFADSHFVQRLESQQESIRAALQDCFSPSTQDYELLEAKSLALSQLRPGHASIISFQKDFAPFRQGGQWSDYALSKRALSQGLLQKHSLSLSKLEQGAVGAELCSHANFYPAWGGMIIAGQVQDIGGVWSSENAYPLGIEGEFSFSCPFGRAFTQSDLSGYSSSVISASSDGSKLSATLFSLPARTQVQLKFSSPAVPISVFAQESTAILTPGRSLEWLQSGELESILDSRSALLALPVPPGSHSPSISLGKYPLPISGRIETNADGTFAIFSLPRLQKGRLAYSLSTQFSLPAQIERKNYVAIQKPDGSADVSYTLKISGLPPSSQLNATLQDGAYGASSLSLFAPSAKAGNIKFPKSGQLYYSFTYSPVLSDGLAELSVQYSSVNLPFSARLQIDSLAYRASLANNSQALSLLMQANLSLSEGRVEDALSQASQAESLLSLQGAGAYENEYQIALLQANDYLGVLSPAANLTFDSSDYGKSLVLISGKLRASISEAEDERLQGKTKSAISTLTSALSDANAKSRAESVKEYEKLTAKIVELEPRLAPLPTPHPARSHYIAALRLREEARQAMLSDSPANMVSPLAGALSELEKISAALKESGQEGWSALAEELASLLSSQSSLSERADKYQQSISLLSKSRYVPILSSASLSSLLKDSAKALGAAQKKPNEKDPNALSEAQASLLLAQSSFNKTLARLSEAELHLENYAKNSYSLASVAVAEAKKYLQDENEAELLSRDLAAASSALAGEAWADAILQGDKLYEKALGMVRKNKPAEGTGQLPLPLIAISLLLAAGLAYLFFVRKGGKENISEEKKKIAKADEPAAP